MTSPDGYLRATHKILRNLPRTVHPEIASDTALGDWYINKIVIDRQPLLLMISGQSRLAILEPARDVKHLPQRIAAIVCRRLISLGAPRHWIDNEIAAMDPVAVAATKDRSVVGQMVDFAKAVPFYLPEGDWGDPELRTVETRLSETPCLCSGRSEDTIWPKREAMALLSKKWN